MVAVVLVVAAGCGDGGGGVGDGAQSACKSLRLEDCADIPWIMTPREIGPVFYDGILAACHRAGFSPKIVQEAVMSTLIGLVSTGIGAGLVTEGFAVIKRPHMVYIPVKTDLPLLPVAAAWKKKSINPVVQRFLDLLVMPSANKA